MDKLKLLMVITLLSACSSTPEETTKKGPSSAGLTTKKFFCSTPEHQGLSVKYERGFFSTSFNPPNIEEVERPGPLKVQKSKNGQSFRVKVDKTKILFKRKPCNKLEANKPLDFACKVMAPEKTYIGCGIIQISEQ